MDKNTVSGLLLMAAVVIGFMMFNKPSKEETEAREKSRQEQMAAAAADQDASQPLTSVDTLTASDLDAMKLIVAQYGTDGTLSNSDVDITYVATSDSTGVFSGTIHSDFGDVDLDSIASASYTNEQRSAAMGKMRTVIQRYGGFQSFAPAFYGEDKTVTLGNDTTNMKLEFASKGAMVQKVTLNKYLNERDSINKTGALHKVVLFDAATGSYDFCFHTGSQKINTKELYFTPVEQTDSSVTMSLSLGAGAEMRVRYTVDQESYLVKMDISQLGMDKVVPMSTTTMEYSWHQQMARNEVGTTFEDRYSCIYYKVNGESPEDLNANKNVTENVTGNVKWVAFKNQFFSSVIIPDQHFNSVDLRSDKLSNKSDYVKDMYLTGQLPYSSQDGKLFGATYFFGPNEYPLLSDLDDKISPDGEDLDLNKLVPMGWGIFGWINRLIVIPVFSLLSSFISNYGIIILLLTIFIKLILFPFTYKSYKSQAKMRLLAPEIKAINEKYPDKADAMKKQQETMALYSRAGASPFSGCLPMLLQMPVLIAMFSFFPNAIEFRGQSFLWVHDLSAPDYICKLPFNIPFYGDHVSLFCLLMTVTNILYTRITMQNQPQNSSMPSMKWMMYLMPVMFLFFFNDYAAALTYYYFLSLLITILQTYVIRHFIIDEAKVRADMLANANKPRKKGGFMARLEAAQKKQEAYMREQAKQNAKKRR